MLPGRLDSSEQAAVRLLTVGQPCQCIEISELDNASLGTPFTAECNRHLPHLMRMKWLLQIRQLVLRRYHAADFTRVHIGIGRTNDNLDGRIELPNFRRRPYSVATG